MEFTLTKQQQAVAQAASNDGSRPVLTTVCLRGNDLIAADGFVMARTTVRAGGGSEPDKLIPAAPLLKSRPSLNGKILITQNGDKAIT